ncbi:MAG: TetR/AcrR family transcriptional regulator [Spirochaetaceae bacterium]|nr:TetR/AcrR family transcriptional regulator [Spirochaetaceae bacterium]
MEIVKAAFTVWGREFYKTTSLTRLARELGVTKPALYRHFASKEALLDAMITYYFDTYANYAKPYMEAALTTGNLVQGLRILVRAVADFNFRNRYFFIFSLMQMYDGRKPDIAIRELRRRGMDLTRLEALDSGDGYPHLLQLAMVASGFFVAVLLKGQGEQSELSFAEELSEKKIEKFIAFVEKKIFHGLGFNKEAVEALDFDALEARLPRTMFAGETDGGLLKAVAGVVAEAGPWNASMDMVARRSGLSKSSLYSHFRNKQDMLAQLFLLEFDRLGKYVKASVQQGGKTLEQLYLALLATADYLRSRPEILVTMDWIRTRRIELGITPSQDILTVFSGIPALTRFDKELHPNWVFYWILFLIIGTLMRCPSGSARRRRTPLSNNDLPDSAFRKVFRFITLGIEG